MTEISTYSLQFNMTMHHTTEEVHLFKHVVRKSIVKAYDKNCFLIRFYSEGVKK